MKHPRKTALVVLLSMLPFANVLSFNGAGDQPETILPAPGYGELDFEAPRAGSYELPVLGNAKNATVLDTDGNKVDYHDMFKGKYTLLNFMYTRCDDLNGCPLTHVVFSRIKDLASKDAVIANNLQMMSMSFDPEYDTPETLKKLAEGNEHQDHMEHMDHGDHHNHGGHKAESNTIDWKYLTTDSYDELNPILDDYGQSVMPKTDNEGKDAGNFSHILRVFLIDPDLRIRNIYSVSFLHPDIIINDLKTLLMEYGETGKKQSTKKYQDVRIGAGDAKDGYDSTDYVTNSLSIKARSGQKTNLVKFVENPPLGLPAVPVPADNPITAEKVDLGRKLFFDRRLSLNNTLSCAMCHIPEQGFTSHELKTPVGFEGRSVRRNAPSIYNTAYYTRIFSDARETTLEHQAWQPMLAHNEMAMPSFGEVIEKIKGLDDYKGMFEKAFDGRPATIETVPDAIASYERTLVSANSKFDRWYFGKEEGVMTDAEIRGFELFAGKAQCITCHTVAEDHALFTDNALHNTGIGWERSMRRDPETERVQIAPGRYMEVKQSIISSVAGRPEGDLGHYEVTQDPDDRWKYRTPSLRNIALTAPYMHDGSLSSLEKVIDFYSKGGIPNETQSPLIKPLDLSKGEKKDLVAFLKTLTGDNVAEIISDSFAAPIGDYSKN